MAWSQISWRSAPSDLQFRIDDTYQRFIQDDALLLTAENFFVMAGIRPVDEHVREFEDSNLWAQITKSVQSVRNRKKQKPPAVEFMRVGSWLDGRPMKATKEKPVAWTPDAPWNLRFDDVKEKFARTPALEIVPMTFLLLMGEPYDPKSCTTFGLSDQWQRIATTLAMARNEATTPAVAKANAAQLIENEKRAREGQAWRAKQIAEIEKKAQQGNRSQAYREYQYVEGQRPPEYESLIYPPNGTAIGQTIQVRVPSRYGREAPALKERPILDLDLKRAYLSE